MGYEAFFESAVKRQPGAKPLKRGVRGPAKRQRQLYDQINVKFVTAVQRSDRCACGIGTLRDYFWPQPIEADVAGDEVLNMCPRIDNPSYAAVVQRKHVSDEAVKPRLIID